MAAAPGLSLFFCALAQASADEAWRAGLHAQIKHGAQAESTAHPGLFTGIDGLLAACTYAQRVEPRYEGLARKCIAALSDFPVWQYRDGFRQARVMYDYDLIEGAAGWVAARIGVWDEGARAALDYLAWLASDIQRMACPHPLQRPGEQNDPERIDLGMAHGVAGVIFALSIGHEAYGGYSDPLRIAADRLCDYYLENHYGWPSSTGRSPGEGLRSAWCYGTPGVAAALIQTSRALGDLTYEELGLRALHRLIDSPRSKWRLSDFALCHGVAGNALVFSRVAAVTGDEKLRLTAEALFDEVAGSFDESTRFGYRALDTMPDSPSFLTGVAGIGLALLTNAGLCDASWTRYLGLP